MMIWALFVAILDSLYGRVLLSTSPCAWIRRFCPVVSSWRYRVPWPLVLESDSVIRYTARLAGKEVGKIYTDVLLPLAYRLFCRMFSVLFFDESYHEEVSSLQSHLVIHFPVTPLCRSHVKRYLGSGHHAEGIWSRSCRGRL